MALLLRVTCSGRRFGISKQWRDDGLQKEEMTDAFRRWKQATRDFARILKVKLPTEKRI
jgi:hypothetical protein